MNKSKKIAIAVVSAVMAGTMALSFTACGPKDDAKIEPKLDESGKLTWAEGTSLNLNVGNKNDKPQGIAYTENDISGTTVMPDGKTYGKGDLKPAWQALSDQLKIKLNDVYQNLDSEPQITTPITNKNIANYDVITGSLSAINQNADNFVNLTEHLDLMPNYKAFLEANPVTKCSLTGNAEGAMFAAPYFDGNDDIEKYSLMNHNWVKQILDLELKEYSTTFKAQAVAKGKTGTAASATPYMGTTGSWQVDTTDPADPTKTVKLTVDYGAALTAAKDAASPLGKAISDAAGKAYDGASGNIVDLQNYAINAKAGEVSGKHLANILREYIKVAYKNGSNAFYTTLSDVFLSASAGWDVDLLVALSRCVVTCSTELSPAVEKVENIYAIAGRETTTQRRVDLSALAGELYGIRGMESRYEYTYFDSKGQIHDARRDKDSYDLINNMSALTAEGLVHIGGLGSDGKKTSVKTGNSGTQTFMLHDYVQTQTKDGISKTDRAKYDVEPVVNAISQWDTNGDGTRETKMRFTESWRSVKNTGFAIPKDSVKGNPDKLSAVLAFIDYFFSVDGQILMTYGPQSTTGDTNPNGWWYATEATGVTLDSVATKVADATNYAPAQYQVKEANKSQYFIYNGKVYTGTAYNGTQVPTLTTQNKNFYVGNEITVGSDKIKQNTGNIKISQVGNYTNYARYFIGSTLPIGNKNQGFEFQASAPCGIDGSNTVTVALLNGTLKHVKLTLASGESPWYLIAPTALPLSTSDQQTLKGSEQTKISGKYFLNTSKVDQITNVYIDLIFYGFDSDAKICGQETLGNYKDTNNGTKMVAKLDGEGMQARETITQNSWYILNKYYKLGYDL